MSISPSSQLSLLICYSLHRAITTGAVSCARLSDYLVLLGLDELRVWKLQQLTVKRQDFLVDPDTRIAYRSSPPPLP